MAHYDVTYLKKYQELNTLSPVHLIDDVKLGLQQNDMVTNFKTSMSKIKKSSQIVVDYMIQTYTFDSKTK